MNIINFDNFFFEIQIMLWKICKDFSIFGEILQKNWKNGGYN